MDDLSLHVLQEIRDVVRDLKAHAEVTDRRFDAMDRRFDDMDRRFDVFREEVRAEFRATNLRITESDVRHATQMTEVIGMMREMHGELVKADRLENRVSRCETDIAELKARVPKKPR
jgi:chaperonin cofactor prefoldin